MDGLLKKLATEINSSIDGFAGTIANTYGLDKSELMEIWEKTSGIDSTSLNVQDVVLRPHVAKKPDVPPIVEPVLAEEPTKEPTRELTKEPSAATTPSSPQSLASTASSTHESGGCPYILTKGESQGQPCGKKP